MINVETEKLVPLVEAGSLFPRTPSRAALFRWALHGVRGRTLESTLVGGQRYTSVDAIRRFIAPINLAPQTVAYTEDERLKTARSARAAAAQRHGI